MHVVFLFLDVPVVHSIKSMGILDGNIAHKPTKSPIYLIFIELKGIPNMGIVRT